MVRHVSIIIFIWFTLNLSEDKKYNLEVSIQIET